MVITESNRIERVVLLTQQILEGQPIKTAVAAEQFEVTQRTIQRDLATISRVLPIYCDGGQWLSVAQNGAAGSISQY